MSFGFFILCPLLFLFAPSLHPYGDSLLAFLLQPDGVYLVSSKYSFGFYPVLPLLYPSFLSRTSSSVFGVQVRVAMYKHQHREEPSVVAVAQLLSTVLYSRRFFPYYTFNVLFGIDSEGRFISASRVCPPRLHCVCLYICCVHRQKGLKPIFFRFFSTSDFICLGKGAVYGYDAIGSFERAAYNCAGTGSALTMSILDNQVRV